MQVFLSLSPPLSLSFPHQTPWVCSPSACSVMCQREKGSPTENSVANDGSISLPSSLQDEPACNTALGVWTESTRWTGHGVKFGLEKRENKKKRARAGGRNLEGEKSPSVETVA